MSRYHHIYSARSDEMSFPRAAWTGDAVPEPGELDVFVGMQRSVIEHPPPGLDLYAESGDTAGNNVVNLLLDVERRVQKVVASGLDVFDKGRHGAQRSFDVPVRLDLSHTSHRILRRPSGSIILGDLEFHTLVKVTQVRSDGRQGQVRGTGVAHARETDVPYRRAERVESESLVRIFLPPWVDPPGSEVPLPSDELVFILPGWEAGHSSDRE